MHEFLEQPLRQEMIRRGYPIPLMPMKAPKGKLQFIESLQPFFNSGEITFAKEIPELMAQFLNFPSGKIDGPNALAYALLMRPGQVVYDGFGADNVVDGVGIRDRNPCWLSLGAAYGFTTGILVQFVDGQLNVIADFVREGDPGANIRDICLQASLETRNEIRLVAGPEHYSGYNHLGLRGAVAKLPAELRRGTAPEVGRLALRELLGRRVRDAAAFRVALAARHTLNALSAGYAFEINKAGVLSGEPRPGMYRCLMEGLEAFTGLLSQGIMSDHGRPNVQYTPSGPAIRVRIAGQGGYSR